MINSFYELQKKIQKKIRGKKEFKKKCHLCGKELIINKEDILYMVDDKTVHSHCFATRKK